MPDYPLYWARYVDEDKPASNNILLIVRISEGTIQKTKDNITWTDASEYADLLIGERAFEGDFFEAKQLDEMINNIL